MRARSSMCVCVRVSVCVGGVIIYSPREARWVIGVAEGKERTLVSEGSMQREGEDNQGQEVARRLAGTMFTLSTRPADGEFS